MTGGTVTATSKLGASIGAGASNSERGTLTIAPASGKVITADAGTDKNSSIPLEGSPFTNSKEVINQLTGTKYFHSETKNMTVITQHPENQRVNDGSSATFTISADGDNLTYQWQQSTGNEGSWTNINGANLSSYTTGTTTMDMSGYQYRCIVTGADGSVTSHAATLTVEAIPVAEVKLNKNNITLTVGDIETLTATVEPTNATNKTVMWSSSDNTVATVDSQTGEVKAISRGEAVITAEAEDGKGAKAICEVEVKQLVTGISLNKTELSLYTGREEKLTATVNPDNANDPTLIWSSDNEDVATVDQNGNVKAISQGKAVITVTANDDSGKTATCTVTVKKKSSGGSVFFWDLKFDTNGGSKIDTVTEWEYSTIDLDEYVPKKEGYKFVGWYADEDLTKKIDEVYLTEDTTVYAKWEKIAEEVPEEPEETEEIKEPETISFLDVKESDWFYEAVFYAVENGLMSGMSEDIFAPNTPLTREMLAVVLYNVEGQQESAEANTFTDVKGDMWYTDAILWANANGIVAGYDNGAYGVGDLITREQFAVMLYRYAQFKDYDTTQGGMAAREYSDYEAISDYARPAVAWAVNAGIMGGMDNGTLNPQGKATRAEAATMLMNFCENVVK
ncbi:MAG: S-layer homology domain-containing protein [Clostridia bacterium]|nr:S-layer homology domain-containing protein [Clostridia bacterium]